MVEEVLHLLIKVICAEIFKVLVDLNLLSIPFAIIWAENAIFNAAIVLGGRIDEITKIVVNFGGETALAR